MARLVRLRRFPRLFESSWPSTRRRFGQFLLHLGTYQCSKRRDASDTPFCFNGYDADSLKYLPRHIRVKFPALLTHRAAISVAAVKTMKANIMNGLSFSGYRKTMLERHRTKEAELEASYVSDIKCRGQQSTIHAAFQGGQKRIQFSSDCFLYRQHGNKRARFPTVTWLVQRYKEYSETTREYHDRHMMMIDGLYLSGDTSYKVTKLVIARASVAVSRVEFMPLSNSRLSQV